MALLDVEEDTLRGVRKYLISYHKLGMAARQLVN